MPEKPLPNLFTRPLGEADAPQPQAAASVPAQEGIIPWVIEFRVANTAHLLRLTPDRMLVLGRLDPNNDGVVIDLSDYGAHERGVSRKHCRLMVLDNRVTVCDLGSSNGTFINGEPLEVGRDYRLNDGDMLTLGRLQLQTRFILKPHASDSTMIGYRNELEVPRMGRGEAILIVADTLEVQQILRFVLRQANFTAHVATDQSSALSALDSLTPPFGLIIESRLNDGDPRLIIQYAQQRHRDVPVLALTNSASSYSLDLLMSIGVEWFIPEPITIDEMLTALRKFEASFASKA